MHYHWLNPRFTVALSIVTTIAVFTAVSMLSRSTWRSLAYSQPVSVGSNNQSLSPTGSSNTSFNIPYNPPKGASNADANIIQSPFRNTFAYVRFNHDLPEREKVVLEGYESFFDTVHVSMPSDGHNTTELNRTRDFSDDAFVPYARVADLLETILDDPELSHVDGMLFFHFDAWIDPMSFFDMGESTQLGIFHKLYANLFRFRQILGTQ
jgi:FAD/FMN-containing dehydrogenase